MWGEGFLDLQKLLKAKLYYLQYGCHILVSALNFVSALSVIRNLVAKSALGFLLFKMNLKTLTHWPTTLPEAEYKRLMHLWFFNHLWSTLVSFHYLDWRGTGEN